MPFNAETLLKRPQPVLTPEFAEKMAVVGTKLPENTRLADLSLFRAGELPSRPAGLSEWYHATVDLTKQEIAQLTAITNALHNGGVRTIGDLRTIPEEKLALINHISFLRFGFASIVFGKQLSSGFKTPFWDYTK